MPRNAAGRTVYVVGVKTLGFSKQLPSGDHPDYLWRYGQIGFSGFEFQSVDRRASAAEQIVQELARIVARK